MAKKSHAPILDHDYQAESDHHTLTRAAEVHGDSKRMAAAGKFHKKQEKSLHTVGQMFGKGRTMGGKHR